MKAFSESLRYEYSLNPESICIDGGCFEGNWSRLMAERYDCYIDAYEPIPEFAHNCRIATGKFPKVFVFNSGLGASSYETTLKINGDSTGRFNDNGDRLVLVHITDVVEAVNQFNRHIDVLKLNIEGAEYEVLERLISTGQIKNVRNIQVQSHFVFDGADKLYKAINAMLELTHEAEWDSAPLWQNWRLR